jgi:hypothetical protein
LDERRERRRSLGGKAGRKRGKKPGGKVLEGLRKWERELREKKPE